MPRQEERVGTRTRRLEPGGLGWNAGPDGTHSLFPALGLDSSYFMRLLQGLNWFVPIF